MLFPVILLTTAVILGILLWAQWQRWQEKKRRRTGVTTAAVGVGHIVVGGCLGIFGYLGLLFVVVWLTLDFVEESTLPGWLNWVVVFGLLVGFFALVWWASMGVGASFATTRLVLYPQGIRLVRLGKTKIAIRWHEPWQLEQFAGIHFRYRYLGERYTDYTLWLQLRQGKKRLTLRFEVGDERVGGLPPYEGTEEGVRCSELAEWLEDEILHRFMMSQEPAVGATHDSAVGATRASPVPPDRLLMKALNFTEEDLALNRDGAFRSAQLAHLRRDRWLTLGTYFVLALLFGGLAVNQIRQVVSGNSSETTIAALIVFLLVCGFCTLMAAVSFADARSEMHVVRVRGRVSLQHYRQSGEYWLRVEDTAVPLTRSMYEAFEDRAVYDLYFAYHGMGEMDKTLISAEKV